MHVKAIVILMLVSAGITSGQAVTERYYSGDGFFDNHGVLEITLALDLNTLLNDRGDEPSYHPAILSYMGENGNHVSMNVGVRVRGHFRKDPGNCDFPPLKIDFYKEEVNNTLFEGEKKLKLVTHCRTRNSKYEQYMLQEYLIYRMYNLMTPASYRVRLASINYIDIENKYEPMNRYAFFIEKTGDVAERLGGVNLKVKNIHPDSTRVPEVTILSVFQYMIGNTDWSIPGLHNIKLVKAELEKPPYAVPYDFDFSGIISIPYAKPHPMLVIKSVRERLYRGFCRPDEEYMKVIEAFDDNQKEIYALFEEFDPLEEKYRKRALNYIDEFFKIIDDPRRVQFEIINNCRTE